MNIMTVEQISKSYGEKVLFDRASFGMEDQDKIGVVGVNGTGKSTFLKVIAGIEKPDEGQVVKGNGIRIRYLAQNPDFDPELNVLEQVLQGEGEELRAVRLYTEAAARLEDRPDSAELQQELLKAGQELDRLGAWSIESEAKSVLSKLGIDRFEAKMGTLSGGQRKRVALAAALVQPSELLILDEPTNHIDSESVAWLETYLKKRRGALLMVTHDRYFLDRVADVMLELDYGKLHRYTANYSRFLELKAEREDREAASEDKRQNLLRKELAWIRRGAKARSTKQKARIERFEQLQGDKPQQKADNLEIAALSSRLGRKIMEFDAVSKSLGGRLLIDKLTYMAVPGDRIGIVGPNGRGKSTLLNLIAGDLTPDSGMIDSGSTVKVGYFRQEPAEMDESMRAIDYIKEAAETVKTDEGTITASQMLERFLFTPTAQWTPIGKLSGGERRRLYLLRILIAAPNVLLLDEPTNDLDIQTLTVLEDYLDDFPGVVVTVSHDRYFLDRVCEKLFAFEGGGRIAIHAGNYSEYMERTGGLGLKEESSTSRNLSSPGGGDSANTGSSAPAANGPDASGAAQASGKKPKFTYKEQREFETIDASIEEAEQKLTDLAAEMERSSSDSAKLQELMQNQQAAEAKLEELMERWTYLNELAEQIEQAKG
ncbi:ABC-F family ATP-binding cassette domain-containing protein [Saccharibacillus sp. CPCC 101409]|uniref:ABC-F family ATP-binding cassette domain-containing protein n=1 Tax=Saccharibacillus sp. CPCC 101409 TaxID=3058041 RepID=UPI0026735343|nr:ABC-F family ATP-binding cassette domain-containing protein [Saccharibacillus sp. CPCC 101409]MDO3408977.1 ABC-F family ATP-binding cassette domain-containing protein [Saccharibacillus sp. CPCC 101409]